MILTKKLNVFVNFITNAHWKSKGYTFELPKAIGRGNNKPVEIVANVVDLPENSLIKIECECDTCGKHFTIPYSNYSGNCKLCNYKNTRNSQKIAFKPLQYYTLDETAAFLKQYNSDTHTQYSLHHFIKSIPNLKESIYHYTPDRKKLVEKVASLLHKSTCKECGTKTSFISMTKGFNEYCSKHSVIRSESKTRNSLNNAIEILKKDYTIVEIPKSIQSNFTLQCKNGHVFDRCLNNGKISRVTDKLCPRCYPRNISKPEYEIVDFLESNGIEVVQQYVIEKQGNGRKTIDIFIPKYNIGIEYDGLMWHSFGKSEYSMFDNVQEEDKNIHLSKTEICKSQGIQLLHIFSNEWEDRQDIWKSVLLAKCGISEKIFARKCTIDEIDTNSYREFCEQNHLQGYGRASIRYGLFYNSELVALASFSKNRFSNKADYELVRFANKLGKSVLGGFSKLLNTFNKNHTGTLLSYANLRWSDGGVYESNGFKLLNQSSPNYWYIDDNGIYSRLKFQRHKLHDSSTRTESEIMFEHGFRRIWDCGNLVYRLV